MFLPFFIFACQTEPDYVLPSDEIPPVQSLITDDSPQTPPEPGNDGDVSETPPPNDAFADTEGLCKPVSSSLQRHPELKSKGIDITSTLSIKEGAGALLIEIVRNDPQKGNVAVFNVSCNMAVSLNYRIPMGIGDVYAVFFADTNGDGPTEDDIMARSELIDTSKAGTLTQKITLEKGASIAPLTLPFAPLEQSSGGSENLPDPVGEPSAGLPEPQNTEEGEAVDTDLPPPIKDSGAPPKEVLDTDEPVK